MVTSPAIPVFAASADPVVGTSGEQTDVAAAQTVTVSGLKAGSTVKLYQIVDGYYKDSKLVKYVLMDPTNGAIAAIGNSNKGQTDGTNDIITEAEITTIANNIQSGAFTADAGVDMTIDATDKTKATASVEPGMYLVLATDPSGETVYNPAVVSVNITDVNKNTEVAGSVDMTKFFTSKDGDSVENVYLKSSTSGGDKKITGSNKAKVQAEGETTGENVVKQDNNASLSTDKTYAKGDTLSKGDTAYFRIDDMTIPSFSEDYTAPAYTIEDKLDTSFAAVDVSGVKVTVGGAEITPSTETSKTYTIAANTADHGFKITFDESYLRSLRGADASARAVVVTFDSVLDNPTYNYAENHNRAEIKYSNSTTDESSMKTIDKDTYHYTFAIDANIDSEDSGAKTTYEYNKVNEKFNASTETWTDQKSANPLEGAVFTLYSDEACSTAVTTATSDADGHITVKGLDEGTYYLKETTAPDGYTLADQTYKFVIDATLDEDGVMTAYSITSTYKDATHSDWTAAGTATYTSTKTVADDGSITNTITRTDDPIAVVDTKLQTLPSTGGNGKYVAVLTAVVLAAGAGIAVFAGKKKEHQEK